MSTHAQQTLDRPPAPVPVKPNLTNLPGAVQDKGLARAGIDPDDADLAKAARELRQYGWHGKYRAVRSGGRNSRLDEMQAAVLRVKLPRLDGWNSRRREIAERYLKALAVPRSSTIVSVTVYVPAAAKVWPVL